MWLGVAGARRVRRRGAGAVQRLAVRRECRRDVLLGDFPRVGAGCSPLGRGMIGAWRRICGCSALLLPSWEVDNALCTSREGDDRSLRGESGEIGTIVHLWGGGRPEGRPPKDGAAVDGFFSARHSFEGLPWDGRSPVPAFAG